MSKSARFAQPYAPVSPVDLVDGTNRNRGSGFASSQEEKQTQAEVRSFDSDSSISSEPSIRSPRAARFAEATSVNSPITGPSEHRSPFADPPNMAETQGKPSDVGFGYISTNDPVEQHATVRSNFNGPASPPLKSALKVPGTPGRNLNPLSPTFREEQVLEKSEEKTDKRQAQDLKIKTRVRMAKMVLRGVNFSCSLIVLSMLATVFSIFNATKTLPARNDLPAWAIGQSIWPQIVLLVIAAISLAFSVLIFWAYYRGGHRRAEKTAVYYTVFSVGFFVFSIIMWAIGAGILHGSKQNGQGKDLWGWSCKDNKRRQLFQDDVSYSLVCRLQDWSLVCCLIEVIVETITIAIYAVVFYRFYSKNKLRKSMDVRDRARSDLYLAQLRSQSAPNTPGFAQTPRAPHFPAMDYKVNDEYDAAENGQRPTTQYVSPNSASSNPQLPQPFRLQAPPIRVHNATPKAPQQDSFEPAPPQSKTSYSPPPFPQERTNEHVAAAPGEQTYDAVPIPGAYASPLTSPAFVAQHGSMAAQMQRGPGQAY